LFLREGIPVSRESGVAGVSLYSKSLLLRPSLGLRENGLYSGVVLLLSLDKEEINE